MNWEALGAIAELIAAFGVILSILYLAAQIRYRSLLGPMFLNLRSVRFRSTWQQFRPSFEGPFAELVDRVVTRYDREGVAMDEFSVSGPPAAGR